jgi:hypothetical protein
MHLVFSFTYIIHSRILYYIGTYNIYKASVSPGWEQRIMSYLKQLKPSVEESGTDMGGERSKTEP